MSESTESPRVSPAMLGVSIGIVLLAVIAVAWRFWPASGDNVLTETIQVCVETDNPADQRATVDEQSWKIYLQQYPPNPGTYRIAYNKTTNQVTDIEHDSNSTAPCNTAQSGS